jgi:hypothetical protein
VKLLYHNPTPEGGLCEYALHQGEALAAVEGVELLWQAPASVAAPPSARLLARLPTPETHPDRPRWQRAWDFVTGILATCRALDRAIARERPDAVMLPCWFEYFAPLWAWRFRRWRRKGVRFGALIHDPVRNLERGGRLWHRRSMREAYSFLDVAFLQPPFPRPPGRPIGSFRGLPQKANS